MTKPKPPSRSLIPFPDGGKAPPLPTPSAGAPFQKLIDMLAKQLGRQPTLWEQYEYAIRNGYWDEGKKILDLLTENLCLPVPADGEVQKDYDEERREGWSVK